MLDLLMAATGDGPVGALMGLVAALWPYVLIALGFSAVIFVHELGHFAVAKWADVRVDKFAIGFGREVFGFTRGETRYCLNILPLGGYVKMLGQEDFDDKTNEWKVKDDPRAFINKSVGARMCIVSAGVVMNVIFAAFLFMLIMMIGVQAPIPIVGTVEPNSPAAIAGIEPGDEVVRIDGQEIQDFKEIPMAVMLSPPHEPMEFTIRRGGVLQQVKVTPRNNPNAGLSQIGVGAANTRKVELVLPGTRPANGEGLRVGDEIVAINGTPVSESDGNRVLEWIAAAGPGPVELTVERHKNPDDPKSPVERVQASTVPELRVEGFIDPDQETTHLLGLSPLIRLSHVEPGSRAYYGGLKEGDIIVRWGDARFPTAGEIKRVTQARQERDIPVEIERFDGSRSVRRQLFVRPKSKFRLSGNKPPEVGIGLDPAATHTTQIGRVVSESDGKPTPAAVAGIPSGARILELGGKPVSDWAQLVEALRAHAGSEVEVTFQADGQRKTVRMAVPHCLRTKLGVPVGTRIVSVDGQTSFTVEIDGTRQRGAIGNNFVLREFLKTRIGQTVPVTYWLPFALETRTASVQITEDMVDPWLGQVRYLPSFLPATAERLIQIKNPVMAMWAGAKKAYYFVMQVYVTMQRMIFSRSVGVENLSGPVGIFKIGGEVAQRGLVDMLFFLGIISANLAVINFLPLPIVDGGLMVFLIIEKIKRSPVSLRVQVATQIIGLFLIITAFVMVTIQDIAK